MSRSRKLHRLQCNIVTNRPTFILVPAFFYTDERLDRFASHSSLREAESVQDIGRRSSIVLRGVDGERVTWRVAADVVQLRQVCVVGQTDRNDTSAGIPELLGGV